MGVDPVQRNLRNCECVNHVSWLNIKPGARDGMGR